jgi:hypothetical protein
MAIVATEIVSDHNSGPSRYITYRCQDSEGVWHNWGPVIADAAFDAQAFASTIAARVADVLSEQEIDRVIDNG